MPNRLEPGQWDEIYSLPNEEATQLCKIMNALMCSRVCTILWMFQKLASSLAFYDSDDNTAELISVHEQTEL
jgi:hypothetical protein